VCKIFVIIYINFTILIVFKTLLNFLSKNENEDKKINYSDWIFNKKKILVIVIFAV